MRSMNNNFAATRDRRSRPHQYRSLRAMAPLVSLVLAVLISQWIASTALSAASSPRPNIIFIFTDDQGVNDVGCYGSEIPTPRIDRLAREGMRFSQFYAASSICTPSRYGLFTGRYPHRSKDHLLGALMFLAEGDAHRGLRQGEQTYVSLLRQAGYRTALVGKWHLGHGDEQFWPTRHGFDSFYGHTGGCVDFFTLRYGNQPDWYRGREIVPTDGYATDVITDEAIAIIQQHASASRSESDPRPLYLHLSYNAPHFGKGWDAAAESTKNVMQPKPSDLEKVQGIKEPVRRAFAAKVIGLDASIGKVLDELDRQKMSNDTLVIFMTDHGGDPEYGGSNLPLRGDKATLFEGGIRVPCIVRWPERIAAGSESDTVACAIDWFPTFCDVVGMDRNRFPLDGKSLLTVLQGQLDQTSSRTLVWRTGAHAELDRKSWLAIRDGDWKWVRPPGVQAMLFDLASDPNEARDLASDHPDVAARLARLAKD